MRRILVSSLGMLAVLMCSAVPGLAFANKLFVAAVPESPTAILVAMGGAGIAWQYFRSRFGK